MMKAVVVVAVFLALFALAVTRWPQNQKSDEIPVHCQTSKGDLEIMVVPRWSPRGAARFLELVDDGQFTDLPIFRCINGFLCQFGAHPPRANLKQYATIPDDPHTQALAPFKKGYLSFAGFAADSRANHIFIALNDSQTLGTQPWETPFGYVTPATFDSTVARFTTRYGDMAPSGTGPEIKKIEAPDGAEYLKANFPELDYFQFCARKADKGPH